MTSMVDRFPKFPKNGRRARKKTVPVSASYPSLPLDTAYPPLPQCSPLTYETPNDIFDQLSSKNASNTRLSLPPSVHSRSLHELPSNSEPQNITSNASGTLPSPCPSLDDVRSMSIPSCYSQVPTPGSLTEWDKASLISGNELPSPQTRSREALSDVDVNTASPTSGDNGQEGQIEPLSSWLATTAPRHGAHRHNPDKIHYINRDGVKHVMREQAGVLIECVNGIPLTSMWSSLNQRGPEEQENICEIEAEDIRDLFTPRMLRELGSQYQSGETQQNSTDHGAAFQPQQRHSKVSARGYMKAFREEDASPRRSVPYRRTKRSAKGKSAMRPTHIHHDFSMSGGLASGEPTSSSSESPESTSTPPTPLTSEAEATHPNNKLFELSALPSPPQAPSAPVARISPPRSVKSSPHPTSSSMRPGLRQKRDSGCVSFAITQPQSRPAMEYFGPWDDDTLAELPGSPILASDPSASYSAPTRPTLRCQTSASQAQDHAALSSNMDFAETHSAGHTKSPPFNAFSPAETDDTRTPDRSGPNVLVHRPVNISPVSDEESEAGFDPNHPDSSNMVKETGHSDRSQDKSPLLRARPVLAPKGTIQKSPPVLRRLSSAGSQYSCRHHDLMQNLVSPIYYPQVTGAMLSRFPSLSRCLDT